MDKLLPAAELRATCSIAMWELITSEMTRKVIPNKWGHTLTPSRLKVGMRLARKMFTYEWHTWTPSRLRVGMRLARKSARTEIASMFPPPWMRMRDELKNEDDNDWEWYLGTKPPVVPCYLQAAQKFRDGQSSCSTGRRCAQSEAKCSCRPAFSSCSYVAIVC